MPDWSHSNDLGGTATEKQHKLIRSIKMKASFSVSLASMGQILVFACLIIVSLSRSPQAVKLSDGASQSIAPSSSSAASAAAAATTTTITAALSTSPTTKPPSLQQRLSSTLASIVRHKDSDTRPKVCQVNGGESVAIVEIEESRGTDFTQSTKPFELPISGSVERGEIELKIESETHKYFHINNKRLQLNRPLNRDAIFAENSTSRIQHQAISSIYLQVSCMDKRSATENGELEAAGKKIIVPVLVKVIDINDNAPRFSSAKFSVQVSELEPIGTILIGADQLKAIDLDSAANGLIEYTLQSSNSKNPKASHEAPRSHYRPTHKPSINLQNEPIINEPMEDREEEEESERMILAALMNSTDPSIPNDQDTEEPDSDESSLILSSVFSPPSNSRLRTRAKRDYVTTTTTSEPSLSGETVKFSESTIPPQTTTNSPVTSPTTTTSKRSATIVDHFVSSARSQLPWTNLMAMNGENNQNIQMSSEISHLTALESQPIDPLDSSDFFTLEVNSWGPVIKLKRQLDFESRQTHQLTILATDKASNKSERLSSSAIIQVRVLDGDDQGPAFILDQSGCATNSVPAQQFAPTTSSFGLITLDSNSRVSQIDPLISSATSKRLNGLRVTDLSDDFDFSDSADRSDQSPSGGLLQQTQANLFELRPNRSIQATQPPEYTCLPSLSIAGGESGTGIAEYFGTVMAGDSDQLVRILPQAIKARDRDQLNAPIRYNFVNGTPANFSQYFQINPSDAWVKQIAPIDRVLGKPDKFVIWLEAQEQTQKRHSTLAKLTIDVTPADWSPPTLIPNAVSGFIEENSPIGTRVMTTIQDSPLKTQPMHIRLAESKHSNDHRHIYEFETTSQAFKVDKDGFVYVNISPLDADNSRASFYTFQVTARLAPHSRHPSGLSRSISSPVSLNVTLIDVNDNGPTLANQSIPSPIKLPASSQAGLARLVTTIQADDRDILPRNTRNAFSLLHVSNGGRDRFRLDETTGELRALGKFLAGEQFSLTVQVSDDLGRSSQSILDIIIVPGPNTGSPQFVASALALASASNMDPIVSLSSEHTNFRPHIPAGDFSAEINEALAPHSAIFQLHAYDPENDPITYSILGGNINNDFYINSRSGIIYLNNKLDREEVSRYHLLVQARDSGGLTSTRSLKITVLDTNDENPVFTQPQYEFLVAEDSPVGTAIGRVRANDGDAAENGEVSYSLEASPSLSSLTNSSQDDTRPIFEVDERSGDIRLLEKLDFERAKTYLLIVKAQDHDKNPRTSLATVLVKILDTQDEVPYFEKSQINLKVWENRTITEKLVQVEAKDPDSTPQVTYEIKWSSDPTRNLFSVDPNSGFVNVNGQLDFESADHHTLLIGTVENPFDSTNVSEWLRRLAVDKDADLRSPVCRIDIQVMDLNDNVPVFSLNQFMPIRVKNSIQLGAQIAKLEAKDGDGSEPNNQIRYQIVENPSQLADNYCQDSFMMDPVTGSISVKADLRRHSESECQLEIKAKDLGQYPGSLSTQATLTVFIDHIAELPTPTTAIGFADSQFTVEIDEKSPPNSLIKVLPIVNKPRTAFPLTCEIVSGNDQGKFYVFETPDRDCEVRLRENQALDYEQRQRYTLMIRLSTIGTTNSVSSTGSNGNQQISSAINQSSGKLMAQVNVNVLDRNDNRPTFKLPARYAHITQGKFIAAIPYDAPTDTQIIQVRASDLDSPASNGLVVYELLNETQLDSRFRVDPIDGILRTSRPIEDLPINRLPIRLKLAARDNPERGPQEALETVAEILVNLIEDRHRLALVLKDTPASRVHDIKEEILSIIQERSGLISGIERVESMKLHKNSSSAFESDVNGADFWFYLVEPGSLRIVPTDDQRIRQTLLDQRARNSLSDVIFQTLGIRDVRIRLPYSTSTPTTSNEGLGFSGASILQSISAQYSRASDRLAGLLISGGILIAFIGTTVLIFQCGSRSAAIRHNKQERSINKHQQFGQLTSGLVPNHMSPVGAQTYFLPFGHSHPPSNANYDSMQPVGSAFSTIPSRPQHNLNNDQSMMESSKEYETQMLKMAVIFDDNHSVDDRNIRELGIKKT